MRIITLFHEIQMERPHHLRLGPSGRAASGGVRCRVWSLAVCCTIWIFLPCGPVDAQGAGDEAKSPAQPLAVDDIEQVRQALEENPYDAALHYNLGTLLYREGAYEEATESLKTAIIAAPEHLQGMAAYNLGNSQYRRGQGDELAAPWQAINLYKQALKQYRSAIRRDLQDRDAQFNHELVERRIKALEEREEQKVRARQQQQTEQAEANRVKAQEALATAEQDHAQAQEALAKAAEALAKAQEDLARAQEDPGKTREALAKAQQDLAKAEQDRTKAQEALAKAEVARAKAERDLAKSEEGTDGSRGQPEIEADREGSTAAEAVGRTPETDESERSSEEQSMSREQALWLLDSTSRGGWGAVSPEQQVQRRKSHVGPNW